MLLVAINISLSSLPLPARALFLIIFHNGVYKKFSRKKDIGMENKKKINETGNSLFKLGLCCEKGNN